MTGSDSARDDLPVLLEHARSLFEYHAGQRLNTINYFFVAYAIVATGYISTLTEKSDGQADPNKMLSAQLALSALALVVSLAFFALDLRNARLVHVDEFALKELEELIGKKHDLKSFEIAKGWERPKYWPLHYAVIIPFLYLVIVLFSAGVMATNAYKALHTYFLPWLSGG
jgi:hypothetical protein